MGNTARQPGVQDMLSFGLVEALLGRSIWTHPVPGKASRLVRSAAQVHDEVFRERVALQAQYGYGTFG